MKHLHPNQQEALDPSTKPERLRALAKKGGVLEHLVAQNPNTPTDLLEELAKKPERKLKEGLAKNPSAPPALLFSLAKLYPQEFLQNPVLPLLFIEDPGAAERLSEEALLALLACEEAPEYLFWIAYQKKTSQRLRLCMAQSPKTPAALLEELAQSVNNRSEALALLENTSGSSRLIAILVTRSSAPHTAEVSHITRGEVSHIKKDALRSGRLSKEYQELLSLVGLLGKANKRYTPSLEALSSLAELGDSAQRYVAEHPSSPAAVLGALSLCTHPICLALAKNPRSPAETLEKLAASPLAALRFEVAKNPSTPSAILAGLASDPDGSIRILIEENERYQEFKQALK